ncbi:selection and upkeep of intraepithelial T-cells protein 8-like [Seriola aureovittata]|uniref:selection and upkeep of intraepithelial T-cells protein 8-like n=1 Tax=Seriola aureovittata TaxID=2871759 RepID=UPI0024BF030F|nr:selection and upkeep of intraepithelial T-cells protein 8-like [Seriola aureovittata]
MLRFIIQGQCKAAQFVTVDLSPSQILMLEMNSEEFMYTSSLWTFFLLLAFLSCSPVEGERQVIGSPQPIVTAPGDDVILPCHLDPPIDDKRLIVEWSKLDLKSDPSDGLMQAGFVHLYRYGQEVLERVMMSYVNRTKLFTVELKHGNVSLKILDVTSADEGRYRCFLPNVAKYSVVHLNVDPNLKNQTTETTPRNLPTPDPGDRTDGRGDQTGPIVWILPVVLLVPLILAAGLSGYLIRRRCQELDGVKYNAASNNPL